MSPASGRVDMVQLDVEGRPYVYSLHDVRYSPGCVARLFAGEPERVLGHHVRSDLMAQLRADGASIPFEIADGHWWTHGVVLPAQSQPVLP
jgi:hypothetical protein